jgi:hypothetical protein
MNIKKTMNLSSIQKKRQLKNMVPADLCRRLGTGPTDNVENKVPLFPKDRSKIGLK